MQKVCFIQVLPSVSSERYNDHLLQATRPICVCGVHIYIKIHNCHGSRLILQATIPLLPYFHIFMAQM